MQEMQLSLLRARLLTTQPQNARMQISGKLKRMRPQAAAEEIQVHSL